MMKMYCLALLLITLLPSCQKESLTREEVIAVIEQFDNGWKNKDAKKVDESLSPSYIYFTQSGGVVSRANIVQTTASPEYKLERMQRRQFDIKIEGNTAIVNTIWSAKGIYGGRPFDDTQRCSVTVIKNKGKVEILSEHCALIK